MNPKPTCPTCGNGLFHCGLPGQPHFCGTCQAAVADSAIVWVCPKCERPLAKGMDGSSWLDPSLACPPLRRAC